jgi:glutamate dehydrogenase (NAD(P)+)
MGTDETCMAWVTDEVGRSVGLPRELGGIPLDEIGATGWGLANAARVAALHVNLELRGARVAIQGFGAVGKHAARFLAEQGAVLVAASDSKGTIHDAEGLDLATLISVKESGQTVCDYPTGRKLDREAIIDIECDVWIPAARPDVVHEDNVERLKARLVVQGANIPFTLGAEKILHRKGVLVVPDFIANAGGVICAAMEYRGAPESEVFAAIHERLSANTEEVLQLATGQQIPPRQAALQLAVARVKRAMGHRRWGVY